QGGGRGAQDRDPVQLHVRLEERRGDEVRRVRVGPPGGQVRRGEARVLEAAGGGLFAGPGAGGGRDVQAVRPPALLGAPQHVPTLPAAEVDRVPGRALAGAGRGGGGGRDVQAVRPPHLLGAPQHVPPLPAAEVDRVPGRELPANGREGGVDLPGPDPRGIGVPLLPVIGGGHVRVAVLVVAVIVM